MDHILPGHHGGVTTLATLVSASYQTIHHTDTRVVTPHCDNIKIDLNETVLAAGLAADALYSVIAIRGGATSVDAPP